LLKTPNFTDMVDRVHVELATSQNCRYLAFLDACSDPFAVEGSLVADDLMAAIMIRDRAQKCYPDHPLATAHLAGIVKSLHIVLRRYGMSRKDRQRAAQDDFDKPPM